MKRNLSIPGAVLIGAALAFSLKGTHLIPAFVGAILFGLGIAFLIIEVWGDRKWKKK